MRYETVKLRYHDGTNGYVVVDTLFEVIVAEVDTAKEASDYRKLRESMDRINSL